MILFEAYSPLRTQKMFLIAVVHSFTFISLLWLWIHARPEPPAFITQSEVFTQPKYRDATLSVASRFYTVY